MTTYAVFPPRLRGAVDADLTYDPSQHHKTTGRYSGVFRTQNQFTSIPGIASPYYDANGTSKNNLTPIPGIPTGATRQHQHHN